MLTFAIKVIKLTVLLEVRWYHDNFVLALCKVFLFNRQKYVILIMYDVY